jgi:hypothetical protein
MKAYHFTKKTLRNGQPIPPIGEWLEHTGPIVACSSGLHASEQPFDALQYAPGNLLHLVELEGDLVSHGNPMDKWVGRRRKILKTIDAEPLLRKFARQCALDVVHLWKCPNVVRRYLETGDESLRAAAYAAAYAAARSAAMAAAWSAAWAAEWATRDSEWAARDAAGAARAAAYAAMDDAGTARAAAWAAAWAAADSAADSAARTAASEAQRNRYNLMVEEEMRRVK